MRISAGTFQIRLEKSNLQIHPQINIKTISRLTRISKSAPQSHIETGTHQIYRETSIPQIRTETNAF